MLLLRAPLGSSIDLLAAANKFLRQSETLSQSLGPNDPISILYRRALEDFQSKLLTQNTLPVTFEKATASINYILASNHYWTQSAVSSGHLLDQRSLQALLTLGILTEQLYDTAFLAAWDDFKTSQTQLSDAFGKSHQLTRLFLQRRAGSGFR